MCIIITTIIILIIVGKAWMRVMSDFQPTLCVQEQAHMQRQGQDPDGNVCGQDRIDPVDSVLTHPGSSSMRRAFTKMYHSSTWVQIMEPHQPRYFKPWINSAFVIEPCASGGNGCACA
jgi:hypothetical protein